MSLYSVRSLMFKLMSVEKISRKSMSFEIGTYQDDSKSFESFGTVVVGCSALLQCLSASSSAHYRHHKFLHHQSLTDCQRSDKIRSAAAAATAQSSWRSVIHRCHEEYMKKNELFFSVHYYAGSAIAESIKHWSIRPSVCLPVCL